MIEKDTTMSDAALELTFEEAKPPVEVELLNTIAPQYLKGLDPLFVEYYNKYQVGRLHTHQMPVDIAKRDFAKYNITFGVSNGPDIAEVKDVICPVENGEITIRVYSPDGVSADSKVPAYINFHGGGWTFGGLDTEATFCKRVCKNVGCRVFDVAYRTSPEFAFPVPVEDSWTAFKFIIENADKFGVDINRLAIGGISAGGHISAALAQRCRDLNIKLCLQLLAVPVMDSTNLEPDYSTVKKDNPYPSWVENAFVPGLCYARMKFFYEGFIGPTRSVELDNNYSLCPIKNPNLKGLAPALIVTSEYDVLRDEGKAYAKLLKESGVEVHYEHFAHEIHAFMYHDALLPSAQHYNNVTISAIRKAFAVGGKGVF